MTYSQKMHEEIYDWNIYVNILDSSGLVTLLELSNRARREVNIFLFVQLEN